MTEKIRILILLIFIQPFTTTSQINFAFDWAGISVSSTINPPENTGVDVDANNNVYVCGNFSNQIDLDFSSAVYNVGNPLFSYQSYLAKYNKNGNLIWGFSMNSFNSNNPSMSLTISMNGVSVDNDGNLICIGQFLGGCDFDPGIDSNVVISKSGSNAFILKLSSNGDFIWVKTLEGYAYSNGDNFGSTSTLGDLDVAANNELIFVGTYNGNVDFDPGTNDYLLESIISNYAGHSYAGFLLSINSNGDFNWVRNYNFIGNEGLTAVKIDDDGHIYAGGYYFDSLHVQSQFIDTTFNSGIVDKTNAILFKLDSEGQEIWGRQFASDNGLINSIEIHQGNIFITGNFIGAINFTPDNGSNIIKSYNYQQNNVILGQDGFICKLDANGSFEWAKGFGNLQSDFGQKILKFANGNLILCTNISADAFYFDSIPINTGSGIDIRAVFFEIDVNGELVSSYSFKSRINDVVIDSENSIIAIGNTYNYDFSPIDYNPSPTESFYFDLFGTGSFVHKMTADCIESNQVCKNEFEIYPNPTNSIVNLKVNKCHFGSKYNIYDCTGKVILKGNIQNCNTIIQLDQFNSGVYFIGFEDKSIKAKKIIIQ